MRVRAHHFQLRDNEYVPFIETDAADAYREVALVAQPGSQEAFLAAPEREVLARRPARHGQDAEPTHGLLRRRRRRMGRATGRAS